MFMVMFVLDNPEFLHEVLNAWEQGGVSGATIFDSMGLQRVRQRHLPMRFVPGWVDREESHLTLMAIVADEEHIQSCLLGAESVVGDLSGAHTGVFAAWPLAFAKGLGGPQP